MTWKYTVNDIIKDNWQTVRNLNLNRHQLRHLHNITKCHTAELGGTVIVCKDCSHIQFKYHSCRNRHCPSCQGSKREEWIIRQQQYLLDVPYFHVVFTLPSELRRLCLAHPKEMYDLLFKASWEVIDTLSKDTKYLGAKPGMTAVLHTWSQNLGLHPHLHCIIPAGGRTTHGKWKSTRSKGKYLFPAKVMASLFRAIFLRELKTIKGDEELILSPELRKVLYSKNWVVYAKRPFSNPRHVIEYLGRYTHKIAISNYRIVNLTASHVCFTWKNYRKGAQSMTMSLKISEFIRRFAIHILPHRFVRIRHYGMLSFHSRNSKIAELQSQQGFKPIIQLVVKRKTILVLVCSNCKSSNITSAELLMATLRAP